MAGNQGGRALPTQLGLAQFEQFVLPHLSIGRRGPAPKLGLHKIFNYILLLLYLGCQGRSCRSKRMAKVVLKFTTRASIAPGGGGRPMAVSTPFLPAQWCSCTGTTFSISRCFTAMARRRQPKRAAITSALAGTRR